MYVDSGKWNDTVISRRKDRLRPKSLEVWWKRQINPADKLIGLRYPAMKEAMVTHTRVKKTRKAKEECKGSHPFLSEKTLPIPVPFSPPSPPLHSFRGKSKEKWRGNGSNCRKDKIRFAARLSTRSRRVGLQGSSTPSVLYILCLFVAVSARLTVTPVK